jgi:hypothetical protein
MLLLVIALILGGQNPTIGFTRDTYIFSALLSLAFAYPLWLYVPEPEGDTLAEPITLSTSVTAVINGAQALAKNRCFIFIFSCFDVSVNLCLQRAAQICGC